MSSLNKGLIFHAPLSEKYEKVGNELVTNGDFSDYTGTIDDSNEDTFSNWNLIESTGDAEFYAVSDAPNGYSTAIKYVQATAPGAGDDHLFYQSISYTTGKKYKLTFWAKSSASKTIYIHDSYAPPHILNKSVTLTTEWQKFDFYWTADDNSDRIKFILGYGASDVYITGISIKEVQTADITPNRNHGIVYGATQNSDYMTFDGEDDYIDFGDVCNPGTNDFSVSVWFKHPTADATNWDDPIVSKKGGGERELGFQITLRGSADTGDKNKLKAWIGKGTGNGTYELQTSETYNDNTWHHAVLTADRDGNAILYVDGVAKVTLDISAYQADLTSTDPLVIGIEIPTETNLYLYNGQIKDVRIYNRVLSEDEVKQLYNLGGRQNNISTTSLNKGLILDMPLKSKNEKVGEELITNGNFESDTSGWSGWNVTLEHETTDTYHGSGALKTTAATEGGNVYQNNISFVSGRTYRICFAHKNLSGTGGGFFIHKQSDGTLLHTVLNYSAESSWTYHVVDVVATYTGNVQIRLTQHNGSVDLYDNISIKELKTADNTPNSNHGTVHGASVSEDYTSFDGTDDYIEINDDSSLNLTEDITISAWVKRGSTGTYAGILGKDTGVWDESTIYQLLFTQWEVEDGLEFRYETSSKNVAVLTTMTFSANQWYHIVAKRWKNSSGNYSIRIYVNGNEIDATGYENDGSGWQTVSLDNLPGPAVSTNGTLRIGHYGKHPTTYFDGQICNVKIWNRALSEEEIKLLYEKGR